jgi:hypothetical protein
LSGEDHSCLRRKFRKWVAPSMGIEVDVLGVVDGPQDALAPNLGPGTHLGEPAERRGPDVKVHYGVLNAHNVGMGQRYERAAGRQHPRFRGFTLGR